MRLQIAALTLLAMTAAACGTVGETPTITALPLPSSTTIPTSAATATRTPHPPRPTRMPTPTVTPPPGSILLEPAAEEISISYPVWSPDGR